MSIEEKLKQLGISLPSVPSAVGAYLPAVRSGNLLFVSGQLPSRGGKILIAGKVGQEIIVQRRPTRFILLLNEKNSHPEKKGQCIGRLGHCY